MKKEKRTFFGIAVFALVIVMAACSNPSGPSDGDFSISGKFKDGEVTKYFKAEKDSGGRAVAAQVPLSGTLDDGDITFHLKGFYDEESGAYTLQAASSMIKYSITGTAEGGASASIATRNNASEPFGTPTFVPITTDITGAELSSGMTSTEENTDIAEGFTRDDVWGVWYDEHPTMQGQFKYVVNEWGITAMLKETSSSEWKEEQTLGFSKIIKEEDDSITVIGDATWATYDYDDYNQEEFNEYLESKGYQLFDENSTPFPDYELFQHPSFGQIFNGNVQRGAFAVGTNKYMVRIYYEPDGSRYHLGTAGKPFVVYSIEQEGAEPIVSTTDAITAATLEEALSQALDAIKATGDASAAWTTQFPWTYTTAGVNTSLAIAQWMEAHPQPEDEESLESYEWGVLYHAFVKEKLLANFSEKFPNPDKLIIQDSDDYWELQDQFMEEENQGSVTYKTEYYRWNVVEEDDKLIIKAYSSDGTMDTVYTDTYAKAKALSQLIEEPLGTLSRTQP